MLRTKKSNPLTLATYSCTPHLAYAYHLKIFAKKKQTNERNWRRGRFSAPRLRVLGNGFSTAGQIQQLHQGWLKYCSASRKWPASPFLCPAEGFPNVKGMWPVHFEQKENFGGTLARATSLYSLFALLSYTKI